MKTKKREKKYWVEAEIGIPCTRKEVKNIAVKANNKHDAISKCCNELEEKGISVVEVKKRTNPIWGIIFLGLTVLMSFFTYHDGFETLELFPNIISTLISVIVYSGFVVRVKGIEKMFNTASSFFISLLFILCMAIFIKLFTGDSVNPSGPIGFLLDSIGLGNSYGLMILGIALSWLGLKQICGFIWLAVFGFGIAELAICDKYLGNLKGTAFILFAFCGFIFYLKYEGKIIINSFREVSNSVKDYVGSDIKASQNLAQKGISDLSKKYNSRKIENKKDGEEDEEN